MEWIRLVIFFSIYLGIFTLVYYLLGFLERRRENNKLTLGKLPFVSVIIPAYNEEETLEKTVKSVLDLNYPEDKIEIIIVDDGSQDRTKEIGKSLEEYNIVHFFSKNNGGKASAMNFGIKKAKGSIVVSFDADSMVGRESLISMIPYFSDKSVMAVTPVMKVYRPRGILQRLQAIEYDLGIFLRKAFSKIDAIHVTPGPFSAYRKEFFDKYGGYDEGNITEDMEVALRMQSLGFKIENCLDSVVYTHAPNTFRSLTKQRRRWYFGMIANLWKYKSLFGKKYGELGLFILPVAILSIAIIITVTFYYLFKLLVDNIRSFELYSLIGFDFFNNIDVQSYSVRLFFQSLSLENIILFSIAFAFATLVLLYLVNRRIKSSEGIVSIFISYVFYVLFYGLLFTFWWIISIFYAITNRKVEW